MTKAIGIAGAGRMGTAFAKRLIETGHEVRIWNRSHTRLEEAVAAGAVASTLPELAACDVILFSLADGAASIPVMEQLCAAGLGGRLVIEASTIRPDDAERLARMAEQAGADFVHCPVGGTVAPALKGQLLGMAGGEDGAVERAMPLMQHLCRRVEKIGTPAAAARMKLAVNMPLAVYWHTLGESLRLLRGAGIDPELAISLIADSSAGPAVLKNRASVVVETLRGTDRQGTFDLAGLAKDLRLAVEELASHGAPPALAMTALRTYESVLTPQNAGFDGATLSRLIAEAD